MSRRPIIPAIAILCLAIAAAFALPPSAFQTQWRVATATADIEGEYAIMCDGSDDYAAASTIATPARFTVMAWVHIRAPAGTSYQSPVIGKYLDATTRDYLLIAGYSGAGNGLKPVFYISTANTHRVVLSTQSITTNNWHHLAGSYNQTNILLYVDGVQVAGAARTGAPDSNSHAVFIGSLDASGNGSPDSGRYLNGMIDDVRKYSRALSSNEIHAVSLGTNITDGLIHFWSMNDGAGDTASDSVGEKPATLLPDYPSNAPSWIETDSIEGRL